MKENECRLLPHYRPFRLKARALHVKEELCAIHFNEHEFSPYSAKNWSTTPLVPTGSCRIIAWPASGMTTVFDRGTAPASPRRITGRLPCVFPPRMKRVGSEIASASARL